MKADENGGPLYVIVGIDTSGSVNYNNTEELSIRIDKHNSETMLRQSTIAEY